MKEKLKTLQIIHLAITIGLVLIYILFSDKNNFRNFNISQIDGEVIIFILMPFFAIALSFFMFKNMINKIDSSINLDNKFGVYQTASIIRWTILEGFALVLLFVKPQFSIFGILIIIYLLLIRPTEDKINNYLNLNF